MAAWVHAHGRQYRAVVQLEEAIVSAWASIEHEYLDKLVKSMPRRCLAVINAKGALTNTIALSRSFLKLGCATTATPRIHAALVGVAGTRDSLYFLPLDDDVSDEDYELEAISEDDEEDEDLSSGKPNEGSTTVVGKARAQGNRVTPHQCRLLSTNEERLRQQSNQMENIHQENAKKYKFKFRVRSSEKTALYNSTHEDHIPTEFEWFQRIYRCTHGIVVRNENHTHSHPTTCTGAFSYLTTKSLPLDDQARENVKTLADARVSSSHITRFLNDRLGT
eukprot:jgi/Phyca11/17170/fgenesh1_pg.PHYCAscaffold_25_\